MGIVLKFDGHGEFLHCTGSGKFSVPGACSMFHEALVGAAERGASKVLIDCRQIGGTPTMVERFTLAEFLAHKRVELICAQKIFPRLSILGEQPLVDPIRFGELAARNQGVQMKAVERMDEALTWLGVFGQRRDQPRPTDRRAVR